MLPLQVEDPSSIPRTRVGIRACNPSTGQVEPGGSFGLAGQLSLIERYQAKERPHLQGGRQLAVLRIVLEVVVWCLHNRHPAGMCNPYPHAYTCVHPYPCVHVHTHIGIEKLLLVSFV